MEKEQILSTINEKLAAQGIKTDPFQRTFGDYLNENLPAEGTEPDDAYFDRHVRILKSLAGQYNHDFAEQVEDFKKNYKPSDKPTETHESDKALLDRIAALEGKLADSERKTSDTAIRSKVESLKNSLKVHNEALWRDCVNTVTIEKNDTEDSVRDKVKELYETKLKAYFGDSAAPYGGTGGEASESASKEAKQRREDFKKRMKSRGKL